MRSSSVGCPTMGWNDAAAVEKDVVISLGVIVLEKSRRYEEEHEW